MLEKLKFWGFMEKGKKAIQENEEEENVFSSLKNYQPNLGSSSTEPPFDQSDSDSAEGEEMEETVDGGVVDDDDFFSKLSKTTGKAPVESLANPAAVAATVVPEAGADEVTGQVAVGTDDAAAAALPGLTSYRKPLSLEEIEDIAKTNPKRAKRIMVNRRSAMRAKEKKKLYASTLEYEFEKLKSQAAQAAALLNSLEAERKSLTHENSTLKDHMKFTKQMIEMQDSKNDEIRKEIQFYEQLVGRQMRAAAGANMMNAAAGANMMSNLRGNATSTNDPNMAARPVFNLHFNTTTTNIHQGVPHGFQQQQAGQHPGQPRQPPQQQHHPQNYNPMRNNGAASPGRHLQN